MSKGKIGQLVKGAAERALHRVAPQVTSSWAHAELAASSKAFTTHAFMQAANHGASDLHSQSFTSMAPPAANVFFRRNERKFSSSSEQSAPRSGHYDKLLAVLGTVFSIGGSAIVIDLLTRERDVIVDTMKTTKTIRNAADFTEEDKETPGGYLSKGWYRNRRRQKER